MSSYPELALEQITLPGAPAIPGLTFRLFRNQSDYAAIAETTNRYYTAQHIEEVLTADEVANFCQHIPRFDPYRDVLLAEMHGQPIGSIRAWVRPLDDGTWLYTTVGCLQPDQWRKGIGRAMLRWGEDRLRAIAVDYPGDAAHSAARFFTAFAKDDELGRRAMLRNAGYEPVRYFYEMVRPNLDALPEAPLPAGLEVRPVGPEQYRAVFAALNEAFRDHWGHTEMTTEEDYQRFINDPDVQPELWQVAWEGDQVAGMILNFISEEHNTKFNRRRGWPDPICVRRPWRKRGLAKALIVRSLHLLKAKGMTEAALGVDTENLSGALRLYESVGFRPASRSANYRKPLK